MITEYTVLEKGRLMQYEFENLDEEAEEFERIYDKGIILRKKTYQKIKIIKEDIKK